MARRVNFRIQAAAGEDEATVYLYDVVDPFWGISAREVVREIDALDVSRVHLRINSPGGDVFDGFAIYNALRRHRAEVVSHVDGMAASIASIIMLAGDEVLMNEGAFVMIHNPWIFAMGDANDMLKAAEILTKLTDEGRDVYARRTGQDAGQITDWMDAETWFNSADAIEAGFATGTEEVDSSAGGAVAVAAHFDFTKFKQMPERAAALVRDPDEKEPPRTIRELERFLRDEGGFSHGAAKRIASGGFKAPAEPRDEADESDILLVRLLGARLTLGNSNGR